MQLDAVIVVTGAASGVGKAISQGFLDDGAFVVAIDRDQPQLEKLKGENLSTRVVDVSSEEQMRRVIEWTIEKKGRLDVLINNAGIGLLTFDPNGEVQLIDHKHDQFETLIRINLLGPYYGMKAAIPIMRKQNYGRIINTMSRHAEIAAQGWSAYGTAKAGLFALMRHAANENLDRDILINGMIPGPVKTQMSPTNPGSPKDAYPTTRMLATLPKGGPTGRVFWNEKEYYLFDLANGAFRR